ncbi:MULTISPECIES: Nif3-like dinuclear metal center hexameric protein [Paenibacillus]|uniref:GTP cyclohydrolase 1 type 2 homolog n=1 Tax=Paenibacillus naphthalenovorans TaxID=162209 RepID=A0A0U2W1R5_9BACL|nr:MULTISPECIES: Nif3-like dinuclear metal center hexameric protein [Paenibacillus]ALS21325.1 Nif3-like dinuclear metal center hexameric protein [Paenibacillus naphthalenovorans]NTZ18514.1 Nif3-like dinuclear metal center hexameric protein [Paenibacillus sp. JMULE4]GCL72581.1 Nif3-like dinuclear metal center hexameric protein [Paenibacillus naphthalenovorans]SDH96810.1 dinuclear metal center protein, YbgI/SA1388 family [Paenibacillus naphthalenovorans]
MYAKGQTVIGLMEELAPKSYAVEGDRIGLQIGTLQKDIRKVLVALDVTEEVADEAIREGADLIIAHHAIIYRPLPHIQTDTPAGRLYEKLIKHDIAVYIAHTNLDVADGGINDMMAEAIGMTVTEPLDEVHTDKLKKLVVFVPADHAEKVRQAMFDAGAGGIGKYSHCSFNIEGTGTFKPGEGTDPFIGKTGKLEEVKEVRVETIVPQSVERKVVQAMLKTHPYEEVAYDLYALDLKTRTFGLGRAGKLPKPVTLAELCEQVKQAFDVPMLRVVGDPDRVIRKAAVLGGSGSRYVKHAMFAGADVLITGDIDYHTAHDALAAGIALIDPGHNVEKIMKQGVAEYLQRKLAERKWATAVVASRIHTEPFRFV